MAEIFNFLGYMFLENDSENFSCYEFGFTENEKLDSAKTTVFIFFDGNINNGNFRLLEPINNITPPSSFSGRYKL